MKALKEISSVSTFQPSVGDVLELYELVNLTPALDREVVQARFLEGRKSKAHFRVVLKDLKERLINGMFTHSFSSNEKAVAKRMKIYKSAAAARMLFASDKKKAGNTIAVETYKQAKSNGLVDVAYQMVREILSSYSVADPSNLKYYHYQAEKKKYLELTLQEDEADEVFKHIAFCINTGKSVEALQERIAALETYANEEYRFNMFYFSCKTLCAYIENDAAAMLDWCAKALKFFDTIKHPMPYVVTWNFYFQAAPVLIARQQYAKADFYLNKSVTDGPRPGTFNWNLSLLYNAVNGFHSGKPKIAFEMWKLSKRHAPKFDSAMVTERWKVVEAYLHFYAKFGVLEMPNKFRLGKFLNETIESSKRKSGQNVALIVAQLLHFLADGKQEQYMKKVETLDKYIHTHLKGEQYKRSRLFFKMLKQVELGDYKKAEVEKLAAKYRVQLEHTEISIGVDLLENEVVRFERVWEQILHFLR